MKLIKETIKNMIIGAISGYSITTVDSWWEVKDNLWLVGILAGILIWIVLGEIDCWIEEWRKENENKAIEVESAEVPEEVKQNVNEDKTDIAEETVKEEQQSIDPDEVFNKAEKYAKNKYGKIQSVWKRDGGTVYVDVDGDRNQDIAFNNQGVLIYDLLDTPTPPKGYAKKSVWYNPLTWF